MGIAAAAGCAHLTPTNVLLYIQANTDIGSKKYVRNIANKNVNLIVNSRNS